MVPHSRRWCFLKFVFLWSNRCEDVQNSSSYTSVCTFVHNVGGAMMHIHMNSSSPLAAAVHCHFC